MQGFTSVNSGCKIMSGFDASRFRVKRFQTTSDSQAGYDKKTRRIWGFVFIMLWSIALGLALHQWGYTANAESTTTRYTVQNGDTVWKIAEKIKGQEVVRSVVGEIETLNRLDSSDTIQPGQVLSIPANS